MARIRAVLSVQFVISALTDCPTRRALLPSDLRKGYIGHANVVRVRRCVLSPSNWDDLSSRVIVSKGMESIVVTSRERGDLVDGTRRRPSSQQVLAVRYVH